jgi:hypothetical protein
MRLSYRRFWVTDFLFYGRCGWQQSFNQQGIGCRQHGARQWSAREVSAARARSRKKMAEWHHNIVRSWHWRKMRSNGLKNWLWWGEEWEELSVQYSTFVIATKRSLAKASIDPGFTSSHDSEDLKGMSTDYGQISDGWLLDVDSSRTLTAQLLLLLLI